MDSSTAEHGRNVLVDIFQGHDRMRVLVRRMSKLFQSGERLFGRKIKHSRVSLDDLKVEGSDLIEESLIGSKPRSMIGLVVQDLLDGGGCFSHPSLLLPSLFLRLDVAFCFGGFADEETNHTGLVIKPISLLQKTGHLSILGFQIHIDANLAHTDIMHALSVLVKSKGSSHTRLILQSHLARRTHGEMASQALSSKKTPERQ